MVCDKCEKKLGKVITPDTWKSGARNTTGNDPLSYHLQILVIFPVNVWFADRLLFPPINVESGGRVVGENKALSSKKSSSRFTPYGEFRNCRICRCKVHQPSSFYCQGRYLSKRIPSRLLDLKQAKFNFSPHIWYLRDSSLCLQKGNMFNVWNQVAFNQKLCPIIDLAFWSGSPQHDRIRALDNFKRSPVLNPHTSRICG